MSDLMLLSQAQMRRIKPYFPLSRGIPRVDDRKIISGIIFVLRNGLRWRDAPKEYGPHKTIYNRFIRWSRLGSLAPVAIQPASGLQHQLAQPDRTWVHLGAGRIEHELFVDPGIEWRRDRNKR
jgi:putative transposase